MYRQRLWSVLAKPSNIPNSVAGPSRNVQCRKIVFEEFGDPIKVAKLVEDTVPDTAGDDQVIVKMIVAPVNPADINTIQGVYPVKPTLPSSPGYEGVGEVISVGSHVKHLVPGDRVIPEGVIGTWRTAAVFRSSELVKVDKDIDIHAISGISSNPCTAYRMLHDFVNLNKNDVIIQNGANSACGQNVVQLARHYGYKSVNVIRKRPEPDLGNLKNRLTSLGATYVLTDEELRTTDIFKSGALPKPRLALNNIGGKSSTEVLRTLDNGGVMVTYGGMSREPVIVPTASFIFKDVQLRGFWMTRWHKQNAGTVQRQQMYDELSKMMKDGELVAPANKTLPLESFKEVLQNTMSTKGYAGVKFFLDLQQL
ncbi:enoyl-[acyl-carrier-protein] reductase, mitochondrial-like [Adelges cooleyi]|uniref:enoyl-[acyl-carrier-protein] reductase, mitochondrial-like n=1 Tax=Adelges cooleyi TaxID=133065 RepID=UPI0021803C7C|nr:enoyl-[acyl-carrier-protein] reductase, mitochondrial-like [Adelges cooleyi]XP_050439671.1 enoyl-[acyl-carrier-protein] reductase, mitochondrial-like [Adelges cooleyi]